MGAKVESQTQGLARCGIAPVQQGKEVSVMYRFVAVFAAALFLGGVVGSAGCSKKVTCESACAKAKKCSKEIAKAIAKKTGAPINDQVLAQIEKGFKDKDQCVKKCKEDEKKDKEKGKALKACFKKSGCEEIAKCFAENFGK